MKYEMKIFWAKREKNHIIKARFQARFAIRKSNNSINDNSYDDDDDDNYSDKTWKKADTIYAIHMIVSMTSTIEAKRNVQRQFVAPVTNGKWENTTKNMF